jgi:hypothetical protein
MIAQSDGRWRGKGSRPCYSEEMTKSTITKGAVLLALALTGTLLAQRVQKLDKTRPSPDDIVTATVGGNKVTVEYSRPSKKGREIFGGLVPFDKTWRTGANEATILTVEGDFMVGKVHVPKGSYGLYTIPGKTGWTLALSKTVQGMGMEWDQAQDIGRTPMKVGKTASPIEQLTVSITPAGGRQGVLKIAWDTTEATVDLTAH